MAQPAATANHTNNNYFLHLGDQNFNVAFDSWEASIQSHESADHHNITMSSLQAIYAFIVTVLLNLVQIKYQGKVVDQSPFETHPKIMFVSIASLLLYCCFSYHVKLRTTPVLSAPPNHYRAAAIFFDYFCKIGLGFCGPLSLASVISLLLPESLTLLVFSLSLLFSISQLLPQSRVETIWDTVTKAVIYIVRIFCGQPPHHHAIRRRRGGGGVQVQLPWLPQQTNSISNRVEILPL